MPSWCFTRHKIYIQSNRFGAITLFSLVILDSVRAEENVMESKIFYVVFFLFGDSPVSEFYVPTFRNTLYVPSSQAV